MARLYNIVTGIQNESKGVQAKLLMARIGLKAGVDLNKITEASPDNSALEEKLLKAVKAVLGKDLVIQ